MRIIISLILCVVYIVGFECGEYTLRDQLDSVMVDNRKLQEVDAQLKTANTLLQKSCQGLVDADKALKEADDQIKAVDSKLKARLEELGK